MYKRASKNSWVTVFSFDPVQGVVCLWLYAAYNHNQSDTRNTSWDKVPFAGGSRPVCRMLFWTDHTCFSASWSTTSCLIFVRDNLSETQYFHLITEMFIHASQSCQIQRLVVLEYKYHWIFLCWALYPNVSELVAQTHIVTFAFSSPRWTTGILSENGVWSYKVHRCPHLRWVHPKRWWVVDFQKHSTWLVGIFLTYSIIILGLLLLGFCENMNSYSSVYVTVTDLTNLLQILGRRPGC